MYSRAQATFFQETAVSDLRDYGASLAEIRLQVLIEKIVGCIDKTDFKKNVAPG